LKRSAVYVFLSLAVLSALACLLVQWNGWTLYYGDAEAHLQVARRMIDSRTPGYAQLGAAWLPLPHLLMLFLVGNDWMWRTGLAGAIPSAIFFVFGGTFLFAAARRVFQSDAAGLVAAGVFALNPNVLYLQATPMTESIFYGSLMALLYFTVLFRDTQSLWAAAAAGIASIAATLTRYEGWFLLPFVAAYFFLCSPKRRFTAAFVYGAIACLGPLAWIIHNVWWFGDPLDFYRGPYSAKAIQKGVPYPGEHDWRTAIEYVSSAGRQCAGWITVGLGLTGIIVTLVKRVFWPLFLLILTPVFYVWSMYSSGTPIFVPNLPPHGYYNTRYGLCLLPLFAFACGALVFVAGKRAKAAAAAILAITVVFWAAWPSPDRWITWKESVRNSEVRRAWTHAGARYLAQHYESGGILTMLGDVVGVYREAGIPLRETLNDGNEPQWILATAQPDYFLGERWAVAQAGDAVSTAMAKAGTHGPRYQRVENIKVDGAPALEIYRRDGDEHTIH
jgi:dolichyl-phosphate-mannose-protein mannosyltransferase